MKVYSFDDGHTTPTLGPDFPFLFAPGDSSGFNFTDLLRQRREALESEARERAVDYGVEPQETVPDILGVGGFSDEQLEQILPELKKIPLTVISQEVRQGLKQMYVFAMAYSHRDHKVAVSKVRDNLTAAQIGRAHV